MASARVEKTEPPGVTSVTPAADRTEPPRTTTRIDAPPGVDAEPRTRPVKGEVHVSADATLGRVGWFLEGRSRADFPAEVKRPVALDEALHFDYPAAALEAHREGIVLAWLMVDAGGAVAELDIISGDDDFSVAVTNALATARLLPATDLYDKPIPFYAVLEFDFRIARAGATSGDSRTAVTVTPPAQ